MKHSKVLLFSLLCLSSFLKAETKYSLQTLPTYSMSEPQTVIGKILPTTPFEIIGQNGNKTIIKITGCHLNGQAQILYFSEGEKIISSVSSKNSDQKIEKIKSLQLDGNMWEQVSITTAILENNFEISIDEINKKAKDLFQSSCSACHPTPELDHFNSSQWPSTMEEMGSRTPLTKDRKSVV